MESTGAKLVSIMQLRLISPNVYNSYYTIIIPQPSSQTHHIYVVHISLILIFHYPYSKRTMRARSFVLPGRQPWAGATCGARTEIDGSKWECVMCVMCVSHDDDPVVWHLHALCLMCVWHPEGLHIEPCVQTPNCACRAH